jgi:hypothetical protein
LPEFHADAIRRLGARGIRPSSKPCSSDAIAVCLQTMDEWDSTEVRIYELIQRPEDA